MGKKIAIKGHSTRGNEVIKLLNILGGHNGSNLLGNQSDFVYFITDSGDIGCRNTNHILTDYFTLEEFLEKYPFKVGDKVFLYDNITEGCVTGMEWDEDKGTVKYCVYTSAEYWCDVKELLKWNAVFKKHDIVTIVSDNGHSRWICEYKSRKADQLLYYRGTYVVTNNGCKEEDLIYNSRYDIYPEDTIRLATPVEVVLFERLIQKNKKHSVLSELPEHIKTTSKEELEQEFDEMNEIQTKRNTEIEHMLLPNKVDDNLEYNIINGYEFDRVENGKIILKPIKPKYPKTYEECCKVMGVNHTNDLDICEHCDYKTEITYYEDNLLEKIEALYRLIICRDAYRKIAGEEMGLGKPWEPDWNIENEIKHVIEVYHNNVRKNSQGYSNTILAFPTKEMRDAFFENFNKEIEQCKELL